MLLTLAPRMDRERLHQLLAFANGLRDSSDEIVMTLASALSTRSAFARRRRTPPSRATRLTAACIVCRTPRRSAK